MDKARAMNVRPNENDMGFVLDKDVFLVAAEQKRTEPTVSRLVDVWVIPKKKARPR
jgi:hypothetical protein